MITNLHITLTAFRSESRLLRETRALVAHGVAHRVYVVALYEQGLAEHEEIDAARAVRRIRLRSRGLSRSIVTQLLKGAELASRVLRFARETNVAIVNIHSLAALPLGVLLKWRLGCKLVYDAHELETETTALSGLRKALFKKVEKALIRFADLVIVVSDGINAWYRREYAHPAIVTVLNCPEFRPLERTRHLRDELGIADEVRIVLYQGALDRGRGIETLLQAFETGNIGDHAIVFMGYGELEPAIRAAALRCRRIFMKSAVPPDELLGYTASADVGVSLIENACLSYYWCLPNKVFEYIVAGVPVIVSRLPEMERVVSETGAGVVLGGSEPQDIARALAELRERDGSAMAENLRKAAARYNWELQARAMIDAYRTHIVRDAALKAPVSQLP